MMPVRCLRHFDIELLHDTEEFSAGDSISGAVLVEPYSSQIINKLRVGIHGAAKVFWIKGISTRNSSQFQNTKYISNSIDYFHVERSLFENRRASAPGGPLEHHPRVVGLAGPDEFPFVFKLPERGFPQSWKGPHGVIHYWIDAVAEVGGKEFFKDHVDRQFRVINRPSSAKLPDPKTQTQKFPVSGFACIPASVSVAFRSKSASYSPGEFLQLHIQIKNGSPWRVSSKIALIQNQSYLARKESVKRIRETISQIECQTVFSHTDVQIENRSLLIPKSCLPSVLNCSIIRNEYSAVLWLKVRRYFADHFQMSLPILIITPTSFTEISLSKEAIFSSEKEALSEISEDTEKEAKIEELDPPAKIMAVSTPGLAGSSSNFMDSRKSV